MIKIRKFLIKKFAFISVLISSLVISNFLNKNTNIQCEYSPNINYESILSYNKSGNYTIMAHNPLSSNFANIAINKIGEKDESFALYSFISGNVTNNIQLINKSNKLDVKYSPDDLISLNSLLDNNLVLKEMKISSKLADKLTEMFKDAKKAKFPYLSIISAYRSYNTQSELFDNKLVSENKIYNDDKKAYKTASQVVTLPGASEHQSGLAIDLTTKSLNYDLVEDFVNTDEGKWIDRNSWKYGFVVRYPSNKTAITDIIYEPWHIRYTGLPHSEIMYNENFCLEEYLDFLKEKQKLDFETYNKNSYKIIYYNSNTSDKYDLDIINSNITDITKITNEEYIITIKIN